MLLKLLLLFALGYLIDASGSQTYNGHGKGYSDYTPPVKSYKAKRRISYPSFNYLTSPSSSSRYSRRLITKPVTPYVEPIHEPSSTKDRYESRGFPYTKPQYSPSTYSDYPRYSKVYASKDFSNHESLIGRHAGGYETPYDATAPGRSPYYHTTNRYKPKSYYTRIPYSGEEVRRSKYEPRRVSENRVRFGQKSFRADQPEQEETLKFYGKSDRRYRNKDPCVNMKEGTYVLDRRFQSLFLYVDPQCYFVKCANKKAYLNPCSTGSRNNEDGEGFCNIIDLEGLCGPSFHDLHRKKTAKY